MYDINTKNVKKSYKFYAIFIIAGVLFAAIMLGIFIAGIVSQNSLDSSTTSTRVSINETKDSDGDNMYSPDYYYEVDNKEYKCSTNVSSSVKPDEKGTTVYYDSKDPSKCRTEYENGVNGFLLLFLILPAVFIVIGIVFINKTKKRVKVINDLNQNGKLVKNLPYHLEESNISVNDVPLMKIVVDYRLPNGQVVKLEGDPRFDRKDSDGDGKVDLVIDEANPENYYLDFEINRISGNRSEDYYVDPNISQEPEPTPVQPSTTEPTPEQHSEPNVPPAIKI